MTSSMLAQGHSQTPGDPGHVIPPWEDWFSAIHHEEGADVCGDLFSDPVGKEYAV